MSGGHAERQERRCVPDHRKHHKFKLRGAFERYRICVSCTQEHRVSLDSVSCSKSGTEVKGRKVMSVKDGVWCIGWEPMVRLGKESKLVSRGGMSLTVSPNPHIVCN